MSQTFSVQHEKDCFEETKCRTNWYFCKVIESSRKCNWNYISNTSTAESEHRSNMSLTGGGVKYNITTRMLISIVLHHLNLFVLDIICVHEGQTQTETTETETQLGLRLRLDSDWDSSVGGAGVSLSQTQTQLKLRLRLRLNFHSNWDSTVGGGGGGRGPWVYRPTDRPTYLPTFLDTTVTR